MRLSVYDASQISQPQSGSLSSVHLRCVEPAVQRQASKDASEAMAPTAISTATSPGATSNPIVNTGHYANRDDSQNQNNKADREKLFQPIAFTCLGATILVGAAYLLFCHYCRPGEKRMKAKAVKGRKELSLTPPTISRQYVKQHIASLQIPFDSRQFVSIVRDCLHLTVSEKIHLQVVVSPRGATNTAMQGPRSKHLDMQPSRYDRSLYCNNAEATTSIHSLPSQYSDSPADTPSLYAEDDSPELALSFIPSALFDVDNLLAMPLEDLEALEDHDNAVTTDNIEDILDEYYSKTHSMLSLGGLGDTSTTIGLGISMPIITLDSCESRPDVPQDVNFADELADYTESSVIVATNSPPSEYLAVPPQQYCAKDREIASTEAEARAIARTHRLSLSFDNKSNRNARPFVDQREHRKFRMNFSEIMTSRGTFGRRF